MDALTTDSLPQSLRACARSSPDTPVTFPELGLSMTLRETCDAADGLAASLVENGVGRGDVVGLLVSAGPQVLVGVVGVTASRAAVSVLPNPPVMRDPDVAARRLTNLIDAAEMRFLLADPSQRLLADSLRTLRPGLTVLEFSDLEPPTGSVGGLPKVDPDDIAVIQYTSGSTARPKGVMLKHRSVLAGLHSIVTSARITADDVFVNWVPHFHDMGLFGWLATLLAGARTHTLSPMGFIRRPADFLRYLAEHGGTITAGPNFSYDLLIDSVDAATVAGLDLSRWRLAFNGAEPVSARTVRSFAERFAPAGVDPVVMYPVYGMAEATLAVTFPEPGEPCHVHHVDRDLLANGGKIRLVDETDPTAKPMVGVGRSVAGLEMRLVDESGSPVPEGTSGEIQIRGAGVTVGYHGAPAATEAAFRGEWFRTGDIGYQYEGELYVAGRLKDMIIINGQNHFPDDVEAVARDVPGVHRGHAVAFSSTDANENEYLTVIAETKVTTDLELAERIRLKVGTELGLTAVRVHLTQPGKLPRTSSGKWQRGLARKLLGPAS
jgi:fatty-acyl-CoA synthase